MLQVSRDVSILLVLDQVKRQQWGTSVSLPCIKVAAYKKTIISSVKCCSVSVSKVSHLV